MTHKAKIIGLGLTLLSVWATLAWTPMASAEQRGRGRPAARQHAKVVHRLPPDHVKVTVGAQPFYFHAGVFYRRATSGFSVVAGPTGARIRVLPRGHRTTVVGGLTYYVYFGTYYHYLPEERIYVVVAPPVEEPAADVIYLLDGDSMAGRFVGGNETSVRFEVDSEIHHVPISEIVAIHFEPPAGVELVE